MLTPIDIQNKVLKTGMGYNKKDVDDFIIDIMRNYEALYKENVELKDKISTLSEGIQYYKTIETTLQKALVLAEKTSKETRDAAILKAEALERDARVKANIIIADAKNDLETIRNQTINLIQNYESFRLQFKKLTATQMELIESESFQIYAPDLEALLSGTAEPLSVSDSMESFYPKGDSPIVKETIAQSMNADAPETAAQEETAGQQAYAQAMQEAAAQPDVPAASRQAFSQPQPDIPPQPQAQPAHEFMSTADLSSELEELQSYGSTVQYQEPSLQLKSTNSEPLNTAGNSQPDMAQPAAQTQMGGGLENPYISPDLKQEGQELDQMIGSLYTDLNVRQEQAAAPQAAPAETEQAADDNMFEFFSTDD